MDSSVPIAVAAELGSGGGGTPVAAVAVERGAAADSGVVIEVHDGVVLTPLPLRPSPRPSTKTLPPLPPRPRRGTSVWAEEDDDGEDAGHDVLPVEPAASSSTSLLVLALQHLIIVVPIGLLFLWLSWPYHVALQTHHTSGGALAQLCTLLREVSTLGLPFMLIPSLYLCCGSYAEVFVYGMTSRTWLLTELLKQLPWPGGTTSKLFTLAQCRLPTAQLMFDVESVGDTGRLEYTSSRRRSSSSGRGTLVLMPPSGEPQHGPRRLAFCGNNTLEELQSVEVQNRRRTKIIIVWQQLRATSRDTGWLKVITKAHHRRLDLNFPTPQGETILHKAVEYRYVKSVERLLEYNVNVNLQVTAMGDDYGNTALHNAVTGLHAGKQSEAQIQNFGHARCAPID